MQAQELKNKSIDELNQLHADWYKGNEKNIRLISDICREIGHKQNASCGPRYMIDEHIGKNRIRVYVDDYGHYSTVYVNEKLVMSTHNEKLFIPGEWVEAFLNKFLHIAEEKETARKNKEQEVKKQKLIDELTFQWYE